MTGAETAGRRTNSRTRGRSNSCDTFRAFSYVTSVMFCTVRMFEGAASPLFCILVCRSEAGEIHSVPLFGESCLAKSHLV